MFPLRPWDLPSAPERGSFVAVPSLAQPFIGACPLRATLEGRAGCCPVPGSERLSPSQGHPASLPRTSARRWATPHVTSHSLAEAATRTVPGNTWRSGLRGLSPPAPSPPGPRHDLHACIHTHSCKREAARTLTLGSAAPVASPQVRPWTPSPRRPPQQLLLSPASGGRAKRELCWSGGNLFMVKNEACGISSRRGGSRQRRSPPQTDGNPAL